MTRMKPHVPLMICLLALAGQLNATVFFKSFEGKQAPSQGKQVLIPEQYRIAGADRHALGSFLSGVSESRSKASIISLPRPDGTTMEFYVWKTSMMEQPLQDKYMDIQTFTAEAKSNKNITAKLDLTVRGFHAMVFDGSNTFMIDPFADVDDGYYTVYYKKDYKRRADQIMSCDIGDDQMIRDASGNAPENMDGTLPGVGLKQYGGTRKRFRLALSCTGEYAAAVGGAIPTTVSVLSAMVTSMNRVNGIYERELGVTMVLIANNDLLVYLNSTSDPFTANNNGGQLLGQNQMNTSSVIGSANYDIGHIFSTGGGGIAFLGCVCRNNQKARGVTGSANPVGDPYDVDYVAHEMGHQFSGNHSFNKCSNTENQSTAYEPGSGSTIMAYAGICGQVNNIQLHSDAYFHSVSLDEITEFLADDATCAVDSPGTTLITLPSISATYSIPFQTPFELTGPVATADASDTISYCWEQWNLGDFRADESGAASFTAGPSFRSFSPSSSRTRVFPRIDSLVQNVNAYRGERLPAVARPLTFRLTARNIVNGFGSFDLSDGNITLNVINTSVPFKVTSPNLSTDTMYANGSDTVTWDVAQTDVTPISTPNVDIFLSVDGGYTYPYILATGVPNTGSHIVTLPDTSSSKARIKVKGAGNVFFDISNANFKLLDTSTVLVSVHDIQLDNELSIFPNPAGSQINMVNTGQRELTLSLHNALGQKMWEGKLKQKVTLPVSSYTRGIYFLRVEDASKGSQTVKRITLQ